MRRFLLSTALVSMLGLAAGAESPVEKYIREEPRRAAFNTHSYEFHRLHDTPAPKGYKPFYISHYGRHGSRSGWMTEDFGKLLDTLSMAAEKGILTAEGDSLLAELSLIHKLHDGMDGRLTQRGVKEHSMLGRRMYLRYREVFRKGSGKVRALSSTVPRCIVSMAAFTGSLSALQPSLEIEMDTGEKFYEYIGKDDDSDKTIKREAKKLLRKYRKLYSRIDTTAVLTTLFSDPVAARELIHDVKGFQYDIYSDTKIAEAFGIKENPYRYLPFENVLDFHRQRILSAYLRQCNSKDLGDRRMALSVPLADSILSHANEVIEGRAERCADLIFGHDWPYLGLTSYFGLDGVGARYSLKEAADKWVGSKYCPFAANLQIIFYRKNPSDREPLVKFLLNEEETLIPELQAVSGPYYRWSDFTAYIAEKDKRYKPNEN